MHPHLTIPWAHLSPYPKWHLNQCSRFLAEGPYALNGQSLSLQIALPYTRGI